MHIKTDASERCMILKIGILNLDLNQIVLNNNKQKALTHRAMLQARKIGQVSLFDIFLF